VNQRNYWMPTIMVSGQGHMILASSAAGINEYINGIVAGRLSSDRPARFGCRSSSRPARHRNNAPADSSGMRRWGDYSAASVVRATT